MKAHLAESPTLTPAWTQPRLIEQRGTDHAPLHSRRSFMDRVAPDARAELESSGIVRSFRSGEVAFLQGERAGRVAIVIGGRAKLTAAGDEGRSVFLGLRCVGDGIGLMDLMDEAPRNSTVTAVGQLTLRVFSLGEFTTMLDHHRDLYSAVSSVLAERVRELGSQRLHSMCPVPTRLAECLLHLAEEHGERRADGALVIDLPFSQDDLAMIVATSRDSVAKTLMVWRRRRIVETSRRSITILDPELLRASV